VTQDSGPTVWQVSGGPTDRPFAEVFLRFGVALIGPGDTGPWPFAQLDLDPSGFVRRLADEMRPGDLVLLRTGSGTVAAVGIVAGDYQYFDCFDDVNGWDLQHGRRVRWGRLSEEYRFESAVFGANPSRLSRVQSPEAMEFSRRFVSSGLTHWQTEALPDLPTAEAALEEVPEELRGIVGLAQDLAGLYWDPEGFGDLPSESEMVAHFVVPFLQALGWKPEHVAIEWRRIDVAVFLSLPRTPQSCHIVIEAKRLGTGLEGARQQAREYVTQLGEPRNVVVTDGFRYRAFSCDQDYEPFAYANLARLKESATKLFACMRRPSGGI